MFSLIESTTKEQTLPLASLQAWWPAEQAPRNAWHFAPFARECVSMAPRPWHPRFCTRHNNFDQSWAFWTCRSYALQVRTLTTVSDLINAPLKIITDLGWRIITANVLVHLLERRIVIEWKCGKPGYQYSVWDTQYYLAFVNCKYTSTALIRTCLKKKIISMATWPRDA